MYHLSDRHELNPYVTTMTSHVKLSPKGNYVTPSMLSDAMALLNERGISVRQSFKNCHIIWVSVKSTRSTERSHNVSVKIFKNLMLHITGTHSLEMTSVVISKLVSILSQQLDASFEHTTPRITMVNYKYALSGRVNLSKLVNTLLQNGTLAIFDPSNYAGVRVKVPIPQSSKIASIMIFESGKVIIVIPETEDRDHSLAYVRDFIDTQIVVNWQSIQLT